MNEYEVIFWGDVINCVRDGDGREYNLQEIISILQEQQERIEKLEKIIKFQKGISKSPNFKAKKSKNFKIRNFQVTKFQAEKWRNFKIEKFQKEISGFRNFKAKKSKNFKTVLVITKIRKFQKKSKIK